MVQRFGDNSINATAEKEAVLLSHLKPIAFSDAHQMYKNVEKTLALFSFKKKIENITNKILL